MDKAYIPQTQKGLFANALVWVFAIFAVVLLIALITFGIRWVTATPKGKLSAREQIQSGSYRIAAYDHFFNACASIQGLEGQLAAQQQAAQTATGDDLSRINANIAGLRGARAQAIAEYNADARKSYTLGQFRASDLPYQIPDDEGKTRCVA